MAPVRRSLGGGASAILLFGIATGCGAPDPDVLEGSHGFTSGADEQADGPAFFAGVLSAVADQAYQSGSIFTQASMAYASTAVPGMYITEWVTSGAAATYAQISPDASGSGVTMPVGAAIVRQVGNASGSVQELTLLMKGPAGFNPSLGDWWFAVTDPNGVPLGDDAGVQVGPLTQCESCHLPRSSDDFLFGVPPADRVQ
jgi:hypothetical protein